MYVCGLVTDNNIHFQTTHKDIFHMHVRRGAWAEPEESVWNGTRVPTRSVQRQGSFDSFATSNLNTHKHTLRNKVLRIHEFIKTVLNTSLFLNSVVHCAINGIFAQILVRI